MEHSIELIKSWLIETGVLRVLLFVLLAAPATAALLEFERRRRNKKLREMAALSATATCVYISWNLFMGFEYLLAASRNSKLIETSKLALEAILKDKDANNNAPNLELMKNNLIGLRKSIFINLKYSVPEFSKCKIIISNYSLDIISYKDFLEKEEFKESLDFCNYLRELDIYISSLIYTIRDKMNTDNFELELDETDYISSQYDRIEVCDIPTLVTHGKQFLNDLGQLHPKESLIYRTLSYTRNIWDKISKKHKEEPPDLKIPNETYIGLKEQLENIEAKHVIMKYNSEFLKKFTKDFVHNEWLIYCDDLIRKANTALYDFQNFHSKS